MRGDRIDNEAALAKARLVLDQAAENLSPDVRSSLRNARTKAVELAERRERKFFLPRWVTAGGVASLAVLVVAVSLWLAPVSTNLPPKGDDEVDIVASGEQLELYDDLDFFLWLAEHDKNAR
ncbi:hypothetical protein OR1_02415 [Geobacter sp. OR-1]|uniref:DUF3619 family protein n=1 Tax=Geobacter sp. OR-1 TaxID=1266765 RepID=UPI000542089B|nr:DUF3619 family protein [Geobacter sp. OR-1]GAM10127.1 hypothetical protein OR1_02415 [Geobacter sp. OR-1]